MPAVSRLAWHIACDWPGCTATTLDDDEPLVYDTASEAGHYAKDYDWWEGRDGRSWYCEKHPAIWASEHENGEPFPAAPYLLIHDGDTDNPLDDDGKVTGVGIPVPCGSCLACDPPESGLFTRMYVCRYCGNKRCPAATDCQKWECSRSNETGQKPRLRDGLS